MIDEQHYKDVEAWWKAHNIDGMQGAKFTVAEYQKYRGRVAPVMKTVTIQELEARETHRRAVETSQAAQKMAADYDAYENMSDLGREELGAKQWVRLIEGQLALAVSRRRTGEIEKLELKLEQAKAYVNDLAQRQAALDVRRTTDLALQAEPAFRYALTSAESYDLDYQSDDATELGVYIQRLKTATTENWQEVVKEFHQWESQRFARIAQEKQAAEAAAIQAADGPVREMNQLGVDAAEAGLQAAERLARSQRLSGPGDLR